MMGELRVLHMASFAGNVGDELNHLGFRPWFEGLVDRPVLWDEKEIRGYFRRDWEFDDAFIREVNEADLLIIGGGNFFETWPERSASGTSIDLTVEDFEKISIPVFINSIGVDTEQGISTNARIELPRLVDYMASQPHRLLSVRNDGAADALRSISGRSGPGAFIDLPDAGFFLPDITHSVTDNRVIGINLACDMPDKRFRSGDRSLFVQAISVTITELHSRHPDMVFRFVPHMYSDYAILADLLESLPDRLRRESFEVVGQKRGGAVDIARAYAGCVCVIANRFHSAVVPVGMGVPTVGICTYPQVSKLFTDLGLPEWCVDGHDTTTLSWRLGTLVDLVLRSNRESLPFIECMRRLRSRREVAAQTVADWLRGSGLAH